MAPNDSQSLEFFDDDKLIVELSLNVTKAVRHFYRNPTNQDEIEDITQNVLLILMEDDYRRLRSFDGRSKFGTWLHKVARNCVWQYFGKRRREKKTVNVGAMSPNALSYQPAQEKTLIDEDDLKALWAILNRLSGRKRRLMELLLQGLKPEEIAEDMGIKIESVYAKKSALLKEIQRSIEREDR